MLLYKLQVHGFLRNNFFKKFSIARKIRGILIFIGFTSVNLTEFSFLAENFARFSISKTMNFFN